MAEAHEDLLAVAHIVKPHGVRGELNAVVLAPPVIDAGKLIVDRRLILRDPRGRTRPVRAVAVRGHQDRWLITLEGVEDMDAAEALRRHDLCLARAELPELPEGWYWEADLQRCRVIDARHGELGEVIELKADGYQPQLLVRPAAGGCVRIPWVRAFVKQVDLEAAEIRTDLPAGFPGLSDDEAEETR